MKYFFLSLPFLLLACQPQAPKEVEQPTLKALIIDGQNNHGVWPKTTMMMKSYLEETGLFTVTVKRMRYTWQGPHYDKSIGVEDIKELLIMYPLENGTSTTSVEEPVPDPDFAPDFEAYDVVISNLGWKTSSWPESTRSKFEGYMSDGGGLVIVHAANNAWGEWAAYNQMIGLGGWGGRDTSTGPYVYYDDQGQLRRDTTAGPCGSHGPEHEYLLTNRAPSHPIMKGLPASWLHTKDELYDRLRGPAENMTVLATAYSDVEKNGPPWDESVKGSGRHEPLLMAINYEKGRIFHTVMGHMDYSMEGVGFITTFQRGTEWAATGKVTQEIPGDFPGKNTASKRKWP